MTKYNPKSLENLRPNWDKESAKKAQEKGLETRRKNKELREKLKVTAAELKATEEELGYETGLALTLLKARMLKAHQEGDDDEATRLAIILAEYEQPKLQRVDQTNLELDASELSEDELEEQIRKLSKND